MQTFFFLQFANIELKYVLMLRRTWSSGTTCLVYEMSVRQYDVSHLKMTFFKARHDVDWMN